MGAKFFVTESKFLEDEVGGGQGFDRNEVRLGDAAKDKGMERAVVGFPNVMGLGVFCRAWAGQHSLQPFGETQAISLNSEPETPLLPV